MEHTLGLWRAALGALALPQLRHEDGHGVLSRCSPLVAMLALRTCRDWLSRWTCCWRRSDCSRSRCLMPVATPQASGWTARIPIMTVLTALASLRLTPEPPDSASFCWAPAAFGLVALRTAWIAWAWMTTAAGAGCPCTTRSPMCRLERRGDADAAPRGRSRTVCSSGGGRLVIWTQNSYLRYPALAVPWRHAFVPVLFAEMGKQPIRVRPPWDALTSPVGGGFPCPVSRHALDNPDLATGDAQRCTVRSSGAASIISWCSMLTGPTRNRTFTPPPELRLLKDLSFAQLFHGSKNDLPVQPAALRLKRTAPRAATASSRPLSGSSPGSR